MRAEGAGYIFKGLHIHIIMTTAIGEALSVCPFSPMPKSSSIFAGLAIRRSNCLLEYTRPDSKICSNLRPCCEVGNLTRLPVKRSASRREALGLLIASTFQLHGVSKASEISDIEETIELTDLPQESSVESENLEGEEGKKEKEKKKKSKLQFTEEDRSELLISAGLTVLILIVTWFTIPDEPDDDPMGPRKDGSQNGMDQEFNENEMSEKEVDISSDEAKVLIKSAAQRTSKD